MPRRTRLVLPGVPMHVVQRGNNRGTTFRCADDFARYLSALFYASRRFHCAVHSYALMPNHVHLLITPEVESGVSRMMQTLGGRYVRYVNDRHCRTGTLWEGRFWSSVIDSERYLLTCCRYIELNPVRARLVDKPHEYRWSSHHHNALGTPDKVIGSHAIYRELGSTPSSRQAAYRALFRSCLDQQTLDEIRFAIKRGTVLGDADFCERMGLRDPRALPVPVDPAGLK